MLPRAAIEEGHNIFLVTAHRTALENGLPAPLYAEWRDTFLQRFPPDQEPDAYWRQMFPLTLYAFSTDAAWRPARYSRVVDTIAFEDLTEFRGGFANDERFNFFGEAPHPITLARNFQADLPFFVMYEFSSASVGSTLEWRGTLWWERADGSVERLAHTEPAGREVTAADVGRKVYALHLPSVVDKPWLLDGAPSADALAVRLVLSPRLAASRIVSHVLGLLALAGILILTIDIAWRRYAAAVGLAAAGAIVVALIIGFSQGKYLGPDYPPHGGGDDGLSHESKGREMAMKAMRGDIVGALQGEQSIFFDTPGMRYFRFAEKVVFGDTNLGYAAFVALFPALVYLLVSRLAGVLPAVAATAFFILSPTGSLSFVQYLQNAKLGYAEAAGFGLFIAGAYLLFVSQPAWNGRRNPAAAFAGAAFLAAVLFLRPNLVLSSIVIGAAFVVAAVRARDWTTAIAAGAGLGLALWMPLHNYAYGGEFVLMTRAGTTISLQLSPLSYARAAGELVTGQWAGEHLAATATQVRQWLGGTPRLPVAALAPLTVPLLVLRWLTLAATVVAAVRPRHGSAPRTVLAWAALASMIPMLFAFAPGQYRYAMIGWDLCAIVTIVTLAGALRPRPAPVPALT
jgi:hypothetical protein